MTKIIEIRRAVRKILREADDPALAQVKTAANALVAEFNQIQEKIKSLQLSSEDQQYLEMQMPSATLEKFFSDGIVPKDNGKWVILRGAEYNNEKIMSQKLLYKLAFEVGGGENYDISDYVEFILRATIDPKSDVSPYGKPLPDAARRIVLDGYKSFIDENLSALSKTK
jgi:hypothetical protein